MGDINASGYVTGGFAMQNPWGRISDIAAKVGVAPIQPGHGPAITMTGADGKNYDVFDVVAAVLDKIDNAVR